VKPGDEVYQLGRHEKARVRAITFPRADLPHFDVGHGPQLYTFFGPAHDAG
jgi:hypothetical protein